MVLLDVTTGLRRGELFALKWSDIDFWNLVIDIRRSICEGVVGKDRGITRADSLVTDVRQIFGCGGKVRVMQRLMAEEVYTHDWPDHYKVPPTAYCLVLTAHWKRTAAGNFVKIWIGKTDAGALPPFPCWMVSPHN